MGTPLFGRLILEALADHYQIVGVVTQPDRKAGRSRKVVVSAVKALALELDLPLLQPRRVGDESALRQLRQLEPGDGKAVLERIRDRLDQRVRTQPTGLPSRGSVFRNPPGDHKARLIESIGLKGYRLGDAQVSEMQANFIINTGTASALDIARLIELMRGQVEQRTGVRLVPGVRILGGGSA